jgi:hypothetical protein
VGLNQKTKDNWKVMTKKEKKKYEELAEEKKKKKLMGKLEEEQEIKVNCFHRKVKRKY